jgi:hypothetical protein
MRGARKTANERTNKEQSHGLEVQSVKKAGKSSATGKMQLGQICSFYLLLANKNTKKKLFYMIFYVFDGYGD